MKKLLCFLILLLMSVKPVLSKSDSLMICQNQSVPDGYVVVQRAILTNDCGSWRSGPNSWKKYTKMQVTKLGMNSMTVCDGLPQSRIPPVGYVVVKKGITGVKCGSWRRSKLGWEAYTGIKIKKIDE